MKLEIWVLGGINVELLKLKQYIYDRLKSLTTIQVYDGKIPSNADEISFPYVVFKIPSSAFDDTSAIRICELDYWDNTNDDSEILQAAEDVKTGFNKYWETQIDGFYKSDIDFEGEIETENKNISGWNQRYILKVR